MAQSAWRMAHSVKRIVIWKTCRTRIKIGEKLTRTAWGMLCDDCANQAEDQEWALPYDYPLNTPPLLDSIASFLGMYGVDKPNEVALNLVKYIGKDLDHE